MCVMHVLIVSQDCSAYVTECAKWGAVLADDLVKESNRVSSLARLVTLEGHYVRILGTKKKPEDQKDSIGKYALRYAVVDPEKVHPILKAEVDKYKDKATKAAK